MTMHKVLHIMNLKKWLVSHWELRPTISNLKFNYQSEKENKNLLHTQFRELPIKASNN